MPRVGKTSPESAAPDTFLTELKSLIDAGLVADAEALLLDFDRAMGLCSRNLADAWLSGFRLLSGVPGRVPADEYHKWENFVFSRIHVLRRGNKQWPAHKILLQLAVEYGDDSPVSHAAQKYLEEGKCDWQWLRSSAREANAAEDSEIVLEGHTDHVHAIVDLPENRYLSWSDDKTLRIWNKDGVCLNVMKGHKEAVTSALVLDDGRILSNSDDGTIRLWSIDGKPLKVMKGGRNDVGMEMAQLDADKFLSWNTHGVVKIWDTEGKCHKILERRDVSLEDVVILPPDRVVTIFDDYVFIIWDYNGNKIQFVEAPKHDREEGSVFIAALPDDRLLVRTYDINDRTWLFDRDGNCLKLLQKNSPELKRLLHVTSSVGNRLNAEEATGVRAMNCDDRVIGIRPLKDGMFASWSSSGSIRLWDQDGICRETLKGHSWEAREVLELKDDRLLSWNGYGELYIWSGQKKQALAMEWGHGGIVFAFQMPNGRLVAVTKNDDVYVWDESGKPLSRHHLGKNNVPADVSSAYSAATEERGRAVGEGKDAPAIVVSYKDGKVSHPLYWHSRTKCRLHGVTGGRALVSECSGQIRVLNVYDGNRQVSGGEIVCKPQEITL